MAAAVEEGEGAPQAQWEALVGRGATVDELLAQAAESAEEEAESAASREGSAAPLPVHQESLAARPAEAVSLQDAAVESPAAGPHFPPASPPVLSEMSPDRFCCRDKASEAPWR